VGRVGVEPTTKRLRGSFDSRQPDEDELKTPYFGALTESGVRLASVGSAASGSSLVADERRLKASFCGSDAPYYYSLERRNRVALARKQIRFRSWILPCEAAICAELSVSDRIARHPPTQLTR
jgi:hypothetical protein